MSMYRVGITGVGGAAGVSCIKALSAHELYGFDCNPLSAGLNLVKRGLIVPPADSPTFFKMLKRLCEILRIDVLIPTVDEELLIIAERKDELPCRVAVAPLGVIRNCLDKRRLMEVLHENVPKTAYPAFKSDGVGFPVVVKPARGRGARDIYVCRDEVDLDYALKVCPKPIIIQEFLNPPEYSVDTLSDLKGNCLVTVPRERTEVKGGVVWRGKIVDDVKIKSLAKWAVEKLGLTGPAVVQMRENKIFEVNPRFGGSTILSVKAGVNIPELAVKLFMEEEIGEIPAPKPVKMARYFEEVYFE
jgi:carbamoyl-phosphate synthase large subunit